MRNHRYGAAPCRSMEGSTVTTIERSVSRERLLAMMTAFKSTYLLRAAIELKVFDALADGPADSDTVAAIVHADARGTRVLLRALAAAGLLDCHGEQFELVPGARELLVTTSSQYCGGVVRVAAGDGEWEVMRDLAGAVRKGGTLLDAGAESPGFGYWVDFATDLTFATRPGARFVADLAKEWGGGRPLSVLDVGAGHGLFGFTVAADDPGTRVWCVDWPEVLAVARRYAAEMGVTGQVEYLPGDMFTTPVEGSYDLIILGNVLFQYPMLRGIELLRRLGGMLRPDGRLVVVGFTTGDRPPAEEYHAHLLNLLMLAWTSGGELHSSAMYRKMLASAGLAEPTARPAPGLPFWVVSALRPAPKEA